MNPLTLLLLITMLAATGRILFYRRNGARFRRHISVLAWFIAVCLTGSAIGLLIRPYHDTPRGIDVLILLLCVRIWRDKGNVARLFGGGHGTY
ncbi:phage holin family protein [Silvimonas sp.]|uniref:phage holin family protein n=1 Tax=Silvimonas sp. TaxID=2650811 RepID=UPI0028437A90|nr:phage holin family protein [Silvimonas sp.]MDR3429678.1 phage holin family protein [Silvimonas sp.]